ncbi:MAG TPA: anhydro-N-acetylmuramic acid kinase [Casimicrobiaceae bacterium]|nr:anhydro-N-acetylmuramic acid kinase [Casimicrobiaceae bacterium]
MRPDRHGGVMSGTSLDGVDAVVAEFASGPHVCRTLGAAHVPFPAALRHELAALQASGDDELARAARASVALADCYADAVRAACDAAGLTPADLAAVGVHGQTVRHRPDEQWTIQLNDPARVAERAGVTVVADFRRRDIAAGGQGAPLVPAFHHALFGRPDRARAVVNLGGIANVTLLVPGAPVRGFDTGPGNVLLDHWHARHGGGPYDEGGAWAASGRVDHQLLHGMLAEPFFAAAPPKSTGRDMFNAGWLDAMLAHRGAAEHPADVQATLAALTARTVADGIRTAHARVADVLVCGGGARNATLMRMLAHELGPARVVPTSDEGIAVDQVEALAFAWLAREALAGRTASLPEVTGAAGPRVLGAIYPK